MSRNWRDWRSVAPMDAKPGDAFAVKVVAVVHEHWECWSAYIGPSDWSDEHVAAHGAALLEEQAKALFHVMRHSEFPYGTP